MNRTGLVIVTCGLVVLSAVLPAAASNGSQEEALSIDLKDADIHDVLNIFAEMTRSELVVDPGLSGTVTIGLNKVSWMTALDAACESAGCQWQLAGGFPRVLTVIPVQPSASHDGLAEPITLRLEDAAATEVFQNFAQVMGCNVEFAGPVGGNVSVVLRGVTLRTALTALCESIECRWELSPDGTTLRVTSFASAPVSEVAVRESLDDPINLELADADVIDVLKTFGKIFGSRVVIATGVSGTITIDIKQVPAGEALTEICAQVGCQWSLSSHHGAALLQIDVAD